jgi:hypothetical protein
MASSITFLNHMDILWRHLKEHVYAFPDRSTTDIVARFQGAVTMVEAKVFSRVFEGMSYVTLLSAL